MENYDAFIAVVYKLEGVKDEFVSDMAYHRNFSDSLVDIKDMIESGYVNHQSDWGLDYHEFFVEVSTVNQMTEAEIMDNDRPDLRIRRSCDFKWPCTFHFACLIVCSALDCESIESKYDRGLFEATMTSEFKAYFEVTLNADAAGAELRFIVQSMGAFELFDPVNLAWWQRLNWFSSELIYWLVIASIFAFFLVLVVAVATFFIAKRRRERSAQAMLVENALVLTVSIGKYERDKILCEIDGSLSDMPAIKHDVENMADLFHNRLGYDFHPLPDPEKGPKLIWRERKLQRFLEKKAKFLSDNVGRGRQYDCLILIVSCHGMPQYILTSDYRKFSKIAVHRAFSLYPNVRTIPRFVLFDCCQGNGERKPEKVLQIAAPAVGQAEEKKEEQMEEEVPVIKEKKEVKEQGDVEVAELAKDSGVAAATEHGKQVEVGDIFADADRQWTTATQNPDHKLGRVNAANEGFTSRLDSKRGSFVIREFYEKYKAMLNGIETRYLFEIFDEIQTELQEQGKQLPECVWNDGTRYIVFKKNGKKKKSVPVIAPDSNAVEMVEIVEEDQEKGRSNTVLGQGMLE